MLDQSTRDRLLDAARGALPAAYAPYSGFRVAAALLVDQDVVITGVNVENVSYGLTICAERAAVVSAVTAGYRTIRAVAIVTDREGLCTPCGACRQVLAEFADADAVVLVERAPGETQVFLLRALLPFAFASIPAE